jgi:hypothetical protein
MEREHIRRGRHNVAGPAPTWWASLCVAQSDCIAAEALKRGSRSSKSNSITCSLLWGCFRWSSASASTPAGCLFQLVHGLDEAARGAESPCAEKRTR